jgi:hypothetical protein
MRNHAAESITRHCANIRCPKCRARVRWYRRKAWHSRNSRVRSLPGKK